MKRLSIFFLNLVFLLIAFFLYRLIFFFAYVDLSHLSIRELLNAFLVGLRFDFATASYVAAPFSLLIVIPFLSRQEKYLRFTVILNLLWLIFITTYTFIDLLYYPFSERYLTFEIFNTEGDIFSLVKTGLSKYMPETVFFILFLFIFSFSYLVFTKRILKRPLPERASFLGNFIRDAFLIFIVGVISVVMARGGIQMKPLNLPGR